MTFCKVLPFSFLYAIDSQEHSSPGITLLPKYTTLAALSAISAFQALGTRPAFDKT